MSADRNRGFIISYLTLRRLIGVLAMALPILVVVGGFIRGGFHIEGSISGYYYTNMRDVFVGLLSIVALFLMSYRGYEKIDDIVGNMSGAFALGMLIFPTSTFTGKVSKVGMFLINENVSAYFHLFFGALFFFSLAFFSLFLFTRHGPGFPGREKRRRNTIYRSCGAVMIVSIACIVVYTYALRETSLARFNPVLILESVALFAFGISWLVKGNTLFQDR